MPIPAHIQTAIQAYYAERATDDDVAALEGWFRADEANIRIFAEHGMVEWQMLCEHEKQDTAAIMTILRESEENAVPDFSLLTAPSFSEPAKAPQDRSITARELGSLAGFVLRKALLSKAGVIGSIAAVLLLGAALTLSLIDFGGSPDTPYVADNTPVDSHEPASATPIVATLTAEHNAKWAEGASAPGAQLRAGQRLTLTQGFAEITTTRGAVALIEAPATIELLDNDNALRLHAGKIVGICETPSSKGFLVRTPAMDITDLGTRFGVQVDAQQVLTSVFDGEILCSSHGDPSRVLYANQTARRFVHDTAAGLTIDERLAGGFESLLTNTLMLALDRLVPRFEGDAIQWAGALAPGQPFFREDITGQPQLFIERASHVLQTPVVVDLSPDRPVFGARTNAAAPTIDAGTRADVYLFHLEAPKERPAQCDVLIRFDRPILGVIVSGQRLVETDADLGTPGVTYPANLLDKDVDRGCEQADAGQIDQVRIEGNTLRLRNYVAGYTDQVRVLVAARPTP